METSQSRHILGFRFGTKSRCETIMRHDKELLESLYQNFESLKCIIPNLDKPEPKKEFCHKDTKAQIKLLFFAEKILRDLRAFVGKIKLPEG